MVQVLIADSLHASVIPALNVLDVDVDERPQLSADELPNAIAGKDILIVRSTKVTAATLAAADQLSLIIRAGAGVNTIDVEQASSQGIHVVNCPGVNAAAVAELAAGLLIAADRRIVDASIDLRNGLWKKKVYGAAHGLKGRRLGILGLGPIGQAVTRIAQGLEMNVLGWSRSLTPEKAAQWGIDRAQTPIEIAQQSDAVSVHLALGDETKHIVDAKFLAAMRDGAILVNTSRGPLVDTAALPAAIKQKQLRVALDVYEDEPSAGECPFEQTELAALITATPHIGASTAQTTEAIGAAVVDLVRSFVRQGHVANPVNMINRSPATHRLVVRHLNQVGVLASVLDGLREENVNVEEMENAVFDGAHAAVCTLHVDSCPSDHLLDTLRARDAILQITRFEIE